MAAFRCGGDFIAGRRRVQLGPLSVEVRRAGDQQPQQLTIRDGVVVLVIALAGCVDWINAADAAPARMIHNSVVAVLARPGRSTLVWRMASEGIVLQFPRQHLQALLNADQPAPVRIAAIDALVDTDQLFLTVLEELAAEAWDPMSRIERDPQHWCRAAEALIVSALRDAPAWSRLTVTARAIQHAVAAIRAGAETDLDPQALATAAGVTLRTLREGFSACFGMSLASYIQQARLAKARAHLMSGCDSRRMHQIAEAVGFRSVVTFARAYQREFEETPTQTRARAAREAPKLIAKL